MIGKAIKGKGARGLLEYLLNGERATIIGGTLAGNTPRQMAAEIGAIRRLRPKLGKAILHLPLSAHPQDPTLSDHDWSDICHYVAQGLGYEGCPMKFIRHNDTDHDHVHMVICRINAQGQAISDSNDYRRIETLLRDVERKYRLRRVEQPGAGSTRNHRKETTMNTTHNTPAPDDGTADTPSNANDVQPDQGQGAEVIDLPVVAMTMTTPEPKHSSKRAADTYRREQRRELNTPQYTETMRELFGERLRNIHQHTGGAVLYFDKPKVIRDNGNSVTAHHMNHQEAAQMLVRMANVKKWKSVTFTGHPDFVRAAMLEALKSGLTVVPADVAQAGMLDEVKGQLCVESVTLAGKSVQPSQLAAFRERRKEQGALDPSYTPRQQNTPSRTPGRRFG
ncbi:MAG: relaxase/mobilization nuclease domain-containing protein [Hydrogenophaga sp.]|uniref:relaxase/mobilization nuclease domain-containing protein n=1 Tax=Hydrogenophaga sp. TaxID=1904254 RepID=UPI002731243F|nr:relaxase/mobilization nuclease domain-containing protein [Hydrogenophaga sp.]MDP2163954.1 relaxase/mobilization nuclease domain-containing protein [Hydrogenophaga sp.]MDP3478117.1 relaxase/mobilization nuclease domain-containing protein [Hydrogenophaga sp.]